MHRFSVTLNFAPKRLSDRTFLSDKHLGAKLSHRELMCPLSFFNLCVYIYSFSFYWLKALFALWLDFNVVVKLVLLHIVADVDSAIKDYVQHKF